MAPVTLENVLSQSEFNTWKLLANQWNNLRFKSLNWNLNLVLLVIGMQSVSYCQFSWWTSAEAVLKDCCRAHFCQVSTQAYYVQKWRTETIWLLYKIHQFFPLDRCGASIYSSQLFSVSSVSISSSCVSLWDFTDPLNLQLTSVRLWVLLELLGCRNSCHFDLRWAWPTADTSSIGECACKLKSGPFFHFHLKENVRFKMSFWSCLSWAFHVTKIADYAACLGDPIHIPRRK